MIYHMPDEETLDRPALRQLQERKWSDMITEIADRNPFYARKYSSTRPALEDLPHLPFTTRQDIERDQQDHPPYGTNLTYPITRYTRLHQTSGSTGIPVRWLDTPESWEWWLRCWSIVFRGAGLTPDDRLAFLFSFGPFIGFWSAFESAAALGNLCLPAGGMTTSARLRYLLDHQVTVVCCTPTYALRMAETAAHDGIDLVSSPVRALIVAGEPGGSIPAVKSRIESAWGARLFDHAGMTEIGAWGFECLEAPGGMHVIESEFIAEVIDPKTTQPVPDGRPGELVLTNLGRWGSPLIRYRTGDQVCLTRERCSCGRWFARSEGGVLGRIDDMLIIRGNNVFPSAIEAIVREFPAVAEFRLNVLTNGPMHDLAIELEPSSVTAGLGLQTALVDAIRNRLHFRPQVKIVEPGTLPRFEMKAKRVVKEKDA